jgi:hypothetical protein
VWTLQPPRWEINGWNSIPGWNQSQGIPVSTSTSNVPLTNWTIVGGQPTIPPPSMSQGVCPPFVALRAFVQKQDSSCPNKNDGSITITADAGQGPYMYSIDGNNYFSTNIFDKLAPNTYSVVVKDSLNNVTSVIPTQIGIINPIPTTYIITPIITNSYSTGTGNQTFEWELDIKPNLLPGQILTLNITQYTSNSEYGPGNGTFNNTYVLKKNGVSIPINTNTNFNQVIPRPFCPSTITQTNNTGIGTVTIGKGDMITGIITSNLVITNPQINAGCATKLETISSVSGNVIRTPGPNQPIGFSNCDNFTLNGIGNLINTTP